MYDIAVIGLGPAGATAARLLSGPYSVLALDKKSAEPPAPREGGFRKACGGLLSPGAQKELARLGLALPLEVLSDPQVFSVRTVDLKNGLVRHYPRGYVNMDRDKFDRWLVSLIPEPADVETDAVFHSARQTGDGFTIGYSVKGEEKTARASFIVGADGAASAVRRIFFPYFRVRSYTAIQEWFEVPDPPALYACLYDPALTDSYAWALAKNGNFILGGAFPTKHALARFTELKRKLSAYPGFPVSAPGIRVEACQVLRPFPFQFYGGKDSVFLIGEAAGFISPSSLEGISHALRSARALAAAFRGARPVPGTITPPLRVIRRLYRRAALGIALKLIVKNLKSPFMYQSFLRFLVMKSGIGSLKVAGRDS